MNIGIVTTWFERGAAMVSRAYMETLAQEHQVFIYARGGEARAIGDPKWDLPNVTWAAPPVYPQLGDIHWPHFAAWVRDRRLDAVLFNEEHYWDIVLKARRLGPLVGAYVDYYTKETAPFFWLYDFLLCNTQRHYSVFKEHPQALYIPWGVDVERFRPQESTAREEVVFFHSAGMGGVNLRKGTDLLVRAFQRVRGPARLVIHSQVGIERYELVADLIRNDPRIEFIERTVGAPGLYHLGDVYVYPSRLEGIGLTIAEALACGLPVITTDCAPMNEFVHHGETGWLVPVERFETRSDGYYWPESICSEVGLAQAMQRCIDDPSEVALCQVRARHFAIAHLDWRRNSCELVTRIPAMRRLSPTPRLVHQVSQYEDARIRPLAMGVVFRAHEAGDAATVRRFLPRGVWSDHRWLKNRGVWSIATQAFLGRGMASIVRRVVQAR